MIFDPVAVIALFAVALAGIAAAAGLYHFANQKLSVQMEQKTHPRSQEEEDPEGRVEKEVLDQLGKNGVKDSSKNRVARALSDFLAAEMERQKNEVRQKYETQLKQADTKYQAIYKKYEQTATEKTQTESIVRSIAEGLVVVDPKGKVLLMNPAAEKLLGTRQEKLGRPITEGVRDDQLISLSKETEGHKGREIVLNSGNDNTKKILRTSTAVIENEQGQTVGMVSVLTDVTKQKELEELKAKFVSNVSHELRTPIVTIQKALAIVHDESTGPLNDAQRKFIEISERNLQNLSRLINDLLDMAKLEAGKMRLECKGDRISEVIRMTVENLQPWAKAKGVSLLMEAPEGLPEIEMDGQRIGQVLTNLIGNAIKFTPSSGTIRTSARPTERGLEVSVADTGPGIPAEELPKLFDRFQQATTRTMTDISGTGLGLSIAKEIVELHGGEIWVESEQGKGTTFRFSLPLHAQQADTGG